MLVPVPGVNYRVRTRQVATAHGLVAQYARTDTYKKTFIFQCEWCKASTTYRYGTRPGKNDNKRSSECSGSSKMPTECKVTRLDRLEKIESSRLKTFLLPDVKFKRIPLNAFHNNNNKLTSVRGRVCRDGPCRRLRPPPPAPPSPPPPPARGRSPAHGSRQPTSHETEKQTGTDR